ncbi:MAG TPA: WD40 repeat domain-containing serine/threonine protein kinase [Ktedonobacteraceae bacterium]
MDVIERYCAKCGAACSASDPACGACGASLKVTRPLDQKAHSPLPELRLAEHLQTLQLFEDRYRVIRQAGAGGFGAVYEALDTWEERKVAIKEIGLAGLSAQEVIEATGSFNREVQMLSSLLHSGIPRMYEQSTDADHWYLVMQFIEGQTLEKIQMQASGGRLPFEQVVQIGIQICTVLEYLHRQQPAVIFRDLKPANIMLAPKGNLYLIDFGVARRYQKTRTRDTIAFGSPGYAAPEQYGRAQTTPLADIYSLGALLHCLLTGSDPSEHPFKFPPLRGYHVDGTREMDALIQRMVASDPMQRPQKARAELLMIQEIYSQGKKRGRLWIPPVGQTPPPVVLPAGGQPLAGSAPQPKQPARKTSRRRVLVSSLIVGGSLLTIGGVSVWGSSLKRTGTSISYTSVLVDTTPTVDDATPTDTTTAVTQNTDATPTSSSGGPVVPVDGPIYWSVDMNYAVVFKDQQQLDVYSVKPQRFLYTIPLPDDAYYYDNGRTIVWSPGAREFSFNTSIDIFIWDIRQKQQYTLSQATDPVVWSPDGQYLVTGGVSTGTVLLLVRAADGKQLSQTYFDDPDALDYIGWSPDSRYLVFPTTSTKNWQSGQHWSMTLWDSWNWRKVGEIGGDLPGSPGGVSYYTASGLAWSPDGKTIAVGINNDIWLIHLVYNQAGPRQKGNSILSGAAINSSSGFTTNTLTWAPNSRYLAISQKEVYGGLSIYDVSGGQRLLTGHNSSVDGFAALAWAADSKSVTTADGENVLSIWKWS